MAYAISDECISCGACEADCPVNAISAGDGKYVIDAATCIECGACCQVFACWRSQRLSRLRFAHRKMGTAPRLYPSFFDPFPNGCYNGHREAGWQGISAWPSC